MVVNSIGFVTTGLKTTAIPVAGLTLSTSEHLLHHGNLEAGGNTVAQENRAEKETNMPLIICCSSALMFCNLPGE